MKSHTESLTFSTRRAGYGYWLLGAREPNNSTFFYIIPDLLRDTLSGQNLRDRAYIYIGGQPPRSSPALIAFLKRLCM